jgi:hypothetical protein
VRFGISLVAILLAGIMAMVLGESRPSPGFGSLSPRSARVFAAMRHVAGARGAASITVDDLIMGLIIEDQDPDVRLLRGFGAPVNSMFPTMPRPKARRPFFSPAAAVYVLAGLYEALPRSPAEPDNVEIPMSPELVHVIQVANALLAQYQQQPVDVHGQSVRAMVPLDLLAAALQERCEGTKLLQSVGVTEEKVTEMIKRGGDLENWNPPEAPK